MWFDSSSTRNYRTLGIFWWGYRGERDIDFIICLICVSRRALSDDRWPGRMSIIAASHRILNCSSLLIWDGGQTGILFVVCVCSVGVLAGVRHRSRAERYVERASLLSLPLLRYVKPESTGVIYRSSTLSGLLDLLNDGGFAQYMTRSIWGGEGKKRGESKLMQQRRLLQKFSILI